MPTPIGHALAGAALALVALPPPRPSVSTSTWTAVALVAGMAAAPDLDLLFQAHRTATHSLGSIVLITILARVVTGKVTASSGDAWRLAALCGLAWGSHVLLDWMGADTSSPRGVQVLWPFSDRWFISEWDVFRRVERRHPFEPATMTANLLTVAQEIVLMLPVVAGAWWIRRRAAYA